jgi:hypothetical protein
MVGLVAVGLSSLPMPVAAQSGEAYRAFEAKCRSGGGQSVGNASAPHCEFRKPALSSRDEPSPPPTQVDRQKSKAWSDSVEKWIADSVRKLGLPVDIVVASPPGPRPGNQGSSDIKRPPERRGPAPTAGGPPTLKVPASDGPLIKTSARPPASTKTRKELLAQEQTLTERIEKTTRLIQQLGFARRAEDFESWAKAATDAKDEFDESVYDAIADALHDQFRTQLQRRIETWDEAQLKRFIAYLETATDSPPNAIIQTLKTTFPDRKGIADRAELIVTAIDINVANNQATSQGEAAAGVFLDLLCEAVPEPAQRNCTWVRTWTEITSKSLFNNATRRIAANEVERLTAMTDRQLLRLRYLHKHITVDMDELKRVRAQLRDLK